MQTRAAPLAIQARVGKRYAVFADFGRMRGASAFPPSPANLENVDEIRVEVDRECDVDRARSIVRYLQILVAGPSPQKLGTQHVDRPVLNHDLTVVHQVGIHQIDAQQNVVFANGRAQEQRSFAAEPDAQSGQETSSLVIQSLGAGDAERSDVAVPIEYAKSVAVFEHTRSTQGQR